MQINCSVRRAAPDTKLHRLIDACVVEIVEVAGVTCCDVPWDRGFVVRAAAC